MAPFQYDALPDSKHWIRTLTLEKGQLDDPLKATLQHVLLEAKPTYDAISYCWGSDVRPHALQIQQSTTNYTVPITTNLYLALRRFRHPTEDITLWNDALCID